MSDATAATNVEKVLLQRFYYRANVITAAFAPSVSPADLQRGELDIAFNLEIGAQPPLLGLLWTHDLRRIPEEPAHALAPADLNDVVEFLQRISHPGLLMPAYDADGLESMLRSLMARAGLVVHQAVVQDSAGRPVGWFVWLLSDDGGRARVVELAADSNHQLSVLTALIRDARKRGATRISGEAHPRWLKAMGLLNGRFVRSPKPISVWTRDTSLLTALLRGDYIWSGLPAVVLW